MCTELWSSSAVGPLVNFVTNDDHGTLFRDRHEGHAIPELYAFDIGEE